MLASWAIGLAHAVRTRETRTWMIRLSFMMEMRRLRVLDLGFGVFEREGERVDARKL